MTKPPFWMLAVLCACVVTLGPVHGQSPAVEIAVQAGRLIDGTSTTVRERATVLGRGGKVIGVQDGFQAPTGARVIDLRPSTVMPGLIDAHDHLTTEGTENA